MRYLTWIEGKYHCGGHLLSEAQIAILSRSLVPTSQVFASIQNYDCEGNIESSPLFMDLDGNLEVAQSDCQYAAHLIEEVMGVEPLVFFSGNKGFHLIVPYLVKHPYCHYVAKAWAKMVSSHLATLDSQVYRSRSMFRVENSKASKEGYYKIRLTIPELFGLKIPEILELARNPRIHDMPIPDMSKMNTTLIDEAIEAGEKLIPDMTNQEEVEGFLADYEEDFTPCLKKLMYNGAPEGFRNTAVMTLAKFLKKCDFSYIDGLNIILSQNFWSNYEQEDNGSVSKVFKTIFNNGNTPRIGCRGHTPQAELMRMLCSEFCFFNSKMPHFSEVFKNGKN